MQPEQIAAWRMHNLRLSGPPLATPVDVVRWLVAVQSQDFAPAKWSVAMRTDGFDDAAMDAAFDAGEILRTHVLRPTWHFVLPEDIRLLLQVTGPRVQAGSRPRWRQLGLDDAVLERSLGLVAEALKGGRHRTRQQVGECLAEGGLELTGERLAHVMSQAELEGVVCSGARQGKHQTYALLDERAPAAARPTDDEALATFTRRYFESHGPASVRDFQAWSSLTLAQIRRGLELAGPFSSLEIDGVTYWYAGEPPDVSPQGSAHLLQMYDELLMGYRETRSVLDVAGTGKVPSLRPSYNGMVLVDTQIAGEWKRTVAKDRVDIRVLRRRPLSATQNRALVAAADRFGEFVGQPPALIFDDPA